MDGLPHGPGRPVLLGLDQDRSLLHSAEDVRIGLCGFTMAFDDYVREYRLVEVQQTFYEPPREGTASPAVRMSFCTFVPPSGRQGVSLRHEPSP